MQFKINNILWNIVFVNPNDKNLYRSDGSKTVGVTDLTDKCIYLSDLVDNELLTTEYLTTEQYNRYKEECPFYPYWPDYYDKTGMSLHSDQKNENYTSNSKFYHYSNYYSKYDIYDEDAGKTPTYSNSILNDNVSR